MLIWYLFTKSVEVNNDGIQSVMWWKKFFKWATDGGGIIDTPSAPSTLFWMPENAATLSATYRKAHNVTFVLNENLKRIDGGALTQSVIDGQGAVAPVVDVEYGWTFDGWDKEFSVITGDLVVTPKLIEGGSVVRYGGFQC